MKMPESASSAIAARIRETAARLFDGSPISGISITSSTSFPDRVSLQGLGETMQPP